MTSTDEACVDRWIQRGLNPTSEGPLGVEGMEHIGGLFELGGRLLAEHGRLEFGRWLGARGAVRLWLLNGDELTSPFAAASRQAFVRRRVSATEVPFVVVPYSVLDAAGIVRDTIELIQHLPEGWAEQEQRSYSLPDGYEVVPQESQTRTSPSEVVEIRRRLLELRLRLDSASLDSGPWPFREITSSDLDTRLRGLPRKVPPSQLRTADGEVIRLQQDGDGIPVYVWKAWRHRLGESVLKATAVRQIRCQACDGSGRVRRVRRLLPARETECAECHGSGTVPGDGRSSYYLSGFDHQEPTPPYFFCELPGDAAPRSVADAYEALKPDPVRLAEQMGRTVYRQGDIFAIAAPSISEDQLHSMGASFRQGGTLLGTNHRATQVALLPNGVTLARGTLTHQPRGRAPDHVERPLHPRAVWHLVVKNTVPPDWR